MKTVDSIKNIPTKENSYINQNIVDTNNLVVRLGIELEELLQAKQLWLECSNHKSIFSQSQKQLDNRLALIYDGYDSYSKHLIVKQRHSDRVVAYVRMIDAHTAYKIGGYFCEAQFNTEKLRSQMQSALELSRMVVDPEFNDAQTLAILWQGILQYALQQGTDIIFGTLPIELQDNHYAAGIEIKRLKSRYLASNKYRVIPYQILPSAPMLSGKTFNLPIEVDYCFAQGAKLCGEPGWNKSFNQAELFFYLKPDSVLQVPQCIEEGDSDISGLVA